MEILYLLKFYFASILKIFSQKKTLLCKKQGSGVKQLSDNLDQGALKPGKLLV